jgi:hypothetical protein
MSQDFRWTVALVVGFILAAFIHGGIYQFDSVGTGGGFRTNKFTGSVAFCAGDECFPAKWTSR